MTLYSVDSFDHAVLICFSSHNTRSLLPWRGLRLYIIAAENVSAPFLLQSCAPPRWVRVWKIVMILLVIIYSHCGFCASSLVASHSLFFELFCYLLLCAIFLLKNVVARGGKNTSNSLHRIERRRKKKIESEFSW